MCSGTWISHVPGQLTALVTMRIEPAKPDLRALSEEVLVVPIFKSEAPRDGLLGSLNSLTNGAIADGIGSGEFDGSDNQAGVLQRTGERACRRRLPCGPGHPVRRCPREPVEA